MTKRTSILRKPAVFLMLMGLLMAGCSTDDGNVFETPNDPWTMMGYGRGNAGSGDLGIQ